MYKFRYTVQKFYLRYYPKKMISRVENSELILYNKNWKVFTVIQISSQMLKITGSKGKFALKKNSFNIRNQLVSDTEGLY